MSASGPASASILALLHRGMELRTPPMMCHWSRGLMYTGPGHSPASCDTQGCVSAHSRLGTTGTGHHHTLVSVQQLVQGKLTTKFKVYFHQQPAQNFPTILVRIISKCYTNSIQYHHPHLPKISYRQLPP